MSVFMPPTMHNRFRIGRDHLTMAERKELMLVQASRHMSRDVHLSVLWDKFSREMDAAIADAEHDRHMLRVRLDAFWLMREGW